MVLTKFSAAFFESLDNVQTLGIDAGNENTATALPGWSVRDVLAHLLHIEELLLTGEEKADLSTDSATGSGVGGDYTQAGIDAYAGLGATEILSRLAEVGAQRKEQLAGLELDPKALAEVTPLGGKWDNQTLFGNRMLDMWIHEQDIRLALGLPLRLDAPAASLTLDMLAKALPMIVAKRAKVGVGHTVRFNVSGPYTLDLSLRMNEAGRAEIVEDFAAARHGAAGKNSAAEKNSATGKNSTAGKGNETNEGPFTELTMTSEEFLFLIAGRKPAAELAVQIKGDAQTAKNILDSMSVVP